MTGAGIPFFCWSSVSKGLYPFDGMFLFFFQRSHLLHFSEAVLVPLPPPLFPFTSTITGSNTTPSSSLLLFTRRTRRSLLPSVAGERGCIGLQLSTPATTHNDCRGRGTDETPSSAFVLSASGSTAVTATEVKDCTEQDETRSLL